MEDIEKKLLEDLKTAMKEKDSVKLETIKLLRAAIKNAKIEKGEDLTEEDIFRIIRKEIKKRTEAIELYKQGGRQELAEKEKKEKEILESYLPPMLSEEEIKKLAQEVIKETGAIDLKDMGKVMKEMMQRVKGRADGATVNKIVRELLSN